MNDGDAEGIEGIGDIGSGGGAGTQSTHSELDQGDQSIAHHSHLSSPDASIAQVSWATRAPMVRHHQFREGRFQELDDSDEWHEIIATQNQCTRSNFELPQLIDTGPFGSHVVQSVPWQEHILVPYPSFYSDLLRLDSAGNLPERRDNGPFYMVVGIFPRGRGVPRETVIFMQRPQFFFWQLFWVVWRLRGVSGMFFSLRHIKGFRLYKVRMFFYVSLSGKHMYHSTPDAEPSLSVRWQDRDP